MNDEHGDNAPNPNGRNAVDAHDQYPQLRMFFLGDLQKRAEVQSEIRDFAVGHRQTDHPLEILRDGFCNAEEIAVDVIDAEFVAKFQQSIVPFVDLFSIKKLEHAVFDQRSERMSVVVIHAPTRNAHLFGDLLELCNSLYRNQIELAKAFFGQSCEQTPQPTH